MLFNRSSGILMHITSLPSPFGIGDFGPQAYEWLDFLKQSRVRWWQVLPLGPTGYGDSPYQSFSSFAGNPMLVSPEFMQRDGLIDSEDLLPGLLFSKRRTEFDKVIRWKRSLFKIAFSRIDERKELKKEFDQFRDEHRHWLDEFVLYMTIKSQEELRPWKDWPAALRDREPKALAAIVNKHAATTEFFSFEQFLFCRQWEALRERMREMGIRVIGDLPIYAAYDSVDVWCNRELFELDERGQLLRVAGVPPDMFSATGQLWGNPLYRWDQHKAQDYEWWRQRLRAVLNLVDVLRLDHFRGFADYWAVPAEDDTAQNGTWELGPGEDFFNVIKKELGELPIIAEDLGGESSPLVIGLRDKFSLPGMRVFQFAFDEDEHHRFLPHNYPENCVAYTGTHDNDTVTGWLEKAVDSEREFCLRYLKSDGKHIAWDMIERLWGSRADLIVAPLQDFLELGSKGRMNFPGRPLGNWGWRVSHAALTDELAERIAELNAKNGRAA
jgi:4-alpha-glucanotransferase